MAARQLASRHRPTWLPVLVVGLAGVLCADVPPPTAASESGEDTFATGTFWLDLNGSPDLDENGIVNEGDLMLLIEHWDECDPELLALLVAEWGAAP